MDSHTETTFRIMPNLERGVIFELTCRDGRSRNDNVLIRQRLQCALNGYNDLISDPARFAEDFNVHIEVVRAKYIGDMVLEKISHVYMNDGTCHDTTLTLELHGRDAGKTFEEVVDEYADDAWYQRCRKGLDTIETAPKPF